MRIKFYKGSKRIRMTKNNGSRNIFVLYEKIMKFMSIKIGEYGGLYGELTLELIVNKYFIKRILLLRRCKGFNV